MADWRSDRNTPMIPPLNWEPLRGVYYLHPDERTPLLATIGALTMKLQERNKKLETLDFLQSQACVSTPELFWDGTGTLDEAVKRVTDRKAALEANKEK